MKTKRLYLDTEFDGHRGQLVSLALVGTAGEEFYEVLDVIPNSQWVEQNVMPNLGKAAVTFAEFQLRLQRFFDRLPPVPTPVEIVADWPDDFGYLSVVLVTGPGTMLELPKTLHMTLVDLPDFDSAKESETPHNALADAKALRRYCEDGTYMPGWQV